TQGLLAGARRGPLSARRGRMRRARPSFTTAVLGVALAAALTAYVRADQLALVNGSKAKARRVHLTFDDGPHPTLTPQLLAILKKNGVHATFFMIGQNVRAHPDVARA